MSDRFEDEQYIQWLKLSLALIYTKEALESFTDREVCALHYQLRPPGSSTGAPPTCCACSKIQLKKLWFKGTFKCYGNVCDKWIKDILQHHVFPRQVEWDNADISQLPLVPWECMKLYIPFGYQQQSNVQEFDLAALLTLYLNCRHFHTFFNNMIICEQVKEVRNRVMHSGQMKVDTAQLLGDVAILKALLQDPQHLINDPDCQEGVRKIDKLMTDKLELSLNKELELRVLNSKMHELEDTVEQMQNKYDDISNEMQTVSGDIVALKRDTAGNQVMGVELQKVKQDIIQLKNSVDVFTNFMTTIGVQGVETARILQCEYKLTSLSQNVEQSLHEHEQRLHQHEQTIQQLEQMLQQYGPKLQQHEHTLQQYGPTMQQHAHTLKQYGPTLQQHAHTLKQNGTTLQQHEQSLQQYEHTLHQHGNTMTALQGDVANIKKRRTTEQSANKKRLVSLENGIQRKRTPYVECSSDDVQKLQQYLMKHYRKRFLWAQNPIMPEREVPLDDIYVDPYIRVLQERCGQSALKEVNQRQVSMLSCKQVFQTGSYKCEQIYITGHAGTGKSTLCQSFVNKWVKAHSGENISSDEHEEEDRCILKEFTLLFCISLRESMSECNITDMIQSQYLQHCADTRHIDSESILRKEKCLVILDGLDEWDCPENTRIPFLDLMENVVILTTTRPWKFDILRLKTSELDKHIELCGLGANSAKQLSYKVIKMLNFSHNGSMRVGEFWSKLEEKSLCHCKSNPVILIQLICLWFDKKGLSESQVALYSSMLDMLLERAEKHLPEETHVTTRNSPVRVSLPKCFLDKCSCQLHKDLILCLSKLAFESLFNENKDESLVFPISTTDHYGILHADIKLCLKCGILSQSKVLGLCSQRQKKLSFLHKKFQEFLAALFIVTSDDHKAVMERITSICSTLDSCLEFSKVFMFVSGINPEIARDLLKHFSSKVRDDERVLTYRHGFYLETTMPVVRDIQTCYVKCLSECRTSGHSYDDLSHAVILLCLVQLSTLILKCWLEI